MIFLIEYLEGVASRILRGSKSSFRRNPGFDSVSFSETLLLDLCLTVGSFLFLFLRKEGGDAM